jgi:hypothetical protein
MSPTVKRRSDNPAEEPTDNEKCGSIAHRQQVRAHKAQQPQQSDAIPGLTLSEQHVGLMDAVDRTIGGRRGLAPPQAAWLGCFGSTNHQDGDGTVPQDVLGVAPH